MGKHAYAAEKAWLDELQGGRRRLDALTNQALSIRETAERVTAIMSESGIVTHNQTSRVENGAVKLVDLAQTVDRAAARLADMIQDRREVIDEVTDAKLWELLTLRYIDGKPWGQVARAMNYDRRWTLCLHVQALAALHRVRADST
ncbi:hypothetical protein AGMMS49992_20580 [Clostridia bacterium]|nr:hypothetical protein AGMMS49992_20580 [Clostridia bacterium]